MQTRNTNFVALICAIMTLFFVALPTSGYSADNVPNNENLNNGAIVPPMDAPAQEALAGPQAGNGAKKVAALVAKNYAVPPQRDRAGEPDAAGVWWRDSNEQGGPAYQWIEIRGEQAAQQLQPSDDWISDVLDLGFTTTWYGENYSSIKVCSNGWITFDVDYNGADYPLPVSPDESGVNNILSVMGYDLNPSQGGEMWYWTNNQDQAVIEWYQVHEFSGAMIQTMEIVINSNGEMLYQYAAFENFDVNRVHVGYENQDGTMGANIAYHQEGIAAELAISIMGGDLNPHRFDVPDEYGTIQEAIDATTADGDTVLVQEGTYYENLSVDEGHQINVFSLYVMDGNADHIWNTIIDGNSGQVMNIAGADSPVHLKGFVVQNGVAAFGGAISANSDISLSINVFRDNHGTSSGGVISAYGATPKTITSRQNTYMNNSTQDYGGVFFLNNVSLDSQHDLIFGNSAGVAGVLGMHNPPVNISFDRATVVDNSDNYGLGGMWIFGVYGDNGNNYPTQVTITNSIFRNAGYEISNRRTVAGHANIYNISYSDFDTDGGDHGIEIGAAIDLNWGVGNFNVNPQIDGNHVVTESSPCIDAGNPNSDDDPDGTRADMGYYYFDHEPGQRTRYAPDVYATLQGAIDAASAGDVVQAAAGTYNENINFNGQNVSVIGDADNPGDYIIDGGDNGPVVTFENSESSDAVLSGFTVQNGTGRSLGGDTFGGGILCINATPSIQYCVIKENVGHYGSGLSSVGANAYPTLDFCTIENNTAWTNTGGVGTYSQGNATLNDCVIQGNSSGNWTGGVGVDQDCNVNLTRCVVANNSTNHFGGGMFVFFGSATIVNCDFYGNTCNNDGGAIFMQASTVDLRNSIVWNNGGSNRIRLWDDGAPSTFNVSYSDIQGGQGSVVGDNGTVNWGDGNVDGDPNFADPDNGDFNLQSPSAAFNGSDPDDGMDPDGTRMEMGPFYYPNADNNPNRFDVPEEYETIQAAIDATQAEGDTVMVQPGTYYEHLTVNKGFGISLFSNFVNSEDQADVDNTILDGSSNGQIIVIQPTDSPFELIGFTLQNGVGGFGGAIATNSPLSVANCTFRSNHANSSGGAITTYGATPWTLYSTNCTYTDNSAGEYGGVFLLNNVNLVSSHDLIAGNTADVGGVLGQHNPPVSISFDFSTVVDNSDNYGVGGMWVFGMYGDNGINYPNEVTITNSIFRNAGYEATNRRTAAGNPNIYTIAYSDFEGGQAGIEGYADYELVWGNGNFDSDPRFADADNGDYSLTAVSSCIDSGDPNADVDPDGTRADIGAYYFYHEQTNWRIQLGASSASADDMDNWAGGAYGASDGFEANWDVPEPPHGPDNWVSLSFPHPDYDNPDARKLSGDFIQFGQYSEGTTTWDFNVQSDLAEEFSLSAIGNDLPFDPTQLHVGVLDLDEGGFANISSNLGGDSFYPFTFGEGGGLRHLQLIVNDTEGPAGSITAPTEGEELVSCTPYTITWTATDIATVTSFDLYVTFDDGESWEEIATALDGNTFEYVWDVQGPFSGNATLAIDAFDGFGNMNSFWTPFSIIDTPPEVTVTYPNDGESFVEGSAIVFEWEQSDNCEVTANRIHIWSNDALGYDEWIDLDQVATSYEWEAPSFYSPFMNVEVFAYDGSENEGSDMCDAEFAITLTSMARDFDSGWSLVSLPIESESHLNADIYGDDLEGPFNLFAFFGIGYRWTGGQWGNDPISGESYRGMGYWLALNEAATIDVEGSSATGENWFDPEYAGKMLDAGWNLLGCPFPTSVPVSEIWFTNDQDESLSFADAVDAEWVLPTVYGFDGEAYNESNSLMPWNGYWFKTLAPVTIHMLPSRNNGGFGAPVNFDPTPENWKLEISAQMGASVDRITALGVAEGASAGFDVWFDQPEPPNVPGNDYVSAFFQHNDWDQNNRLGRRFNGDFRSAIEPGSSDQWTLTVTTGDEGNVTLSWGDLDRTIPEGYVVTLSDVANENEINIRENDSYEYFSNGSHQFILTASAPNAGPETRDLHIALRQGWNMISLNVVPGPDFYDPENDLGPDVRLILDQLRDDQGNSFVGLIKDEHGRFYIPSIAFSNIPYWDLAQGYQVKLDRQCELVHTGTQIPVNTPIQIENGWNIISYYPDYQLSASAPDFYVLSSIIDNVILAKNQSGQFLATRAHYSNMAPWREGMGYQIKVSGDVELTYPSPENQIGALFERPASSSNSHWPTPVSTGRNMSVLLTGFVGVIVNAGDEIAAFDKEGTLVGHGTIDADRNCGLAVWGDDLEVEGRQGLLEGEEFTIALWQSAAGQELPIDVRAVLEGDGLVYTTDDFSQVETKAAAQIPLSYYLEGAYPNPFNATTSISFGLPEKTNVKLSVVNIAGQTVAVIQSGEQAAGRYNLRWNAESLSSGVYFIRLEAGNFSAYKKVNLLK